MFSGHRHIHILHLIFSLSLSLSLSLALSLSLHHSTSPQMGSYVPAKSAQVGVVDRLFARIGASDNVAKHMSTFHMEMTETANILTTATPRSFVILDEIGTISLTIF